MNPNDIINNLLADAYEYINNPSGLDQLLLTLEEKLRTVPEVGNTLSGLPVVIAMVKSWIKGEYEVQPKVLATIIAAFLYFIKVKDIIPDNIPVVGVVDDVAVLMFALKVVEPEINAYLQLPDCLRP